MTVCAVKLRCMPHVNDMLDGYAQWGEDILSHGHGRERQQPQQQKIDGGGGGGGLGMPTTQWREGHRYRTVPPPIAGLLGGSTPHPSSSEALVVSERTIVVSDRGGVEGSDYSTSHFHDHHHHHRNQIKFDTLMADVNTVFDGTAYGQGQSSSSAVDIDRPSSVADCMYIDLLLSMPCYLNLSAFGVYGSSREVSVSIAALEAVRLNGTLLGGGNDDDDDDEEIGASGGYFVPHNCDGRPVVPTTMSTTNTSHEEKGRKKEGMIVDPRSVVCLVLGEGPIPRTAILASTHYGWTTIAIDAHLSGQWTGRQADVPNYCGYAGTLCDFMEKVGGGGSGGGGSSMENSVESLPMRLGYPRGDIPLRHLVIIGIQPNDQCDPVRMTGTGHIHEVRSCYNDVPTTVVSLSPVLRTLSTLAPPEAKERRKIVHRRNNSLERDLGYAPNSWYVDGGVFSICREVKVWNFHNTEQEEDDNEEMEEEEDYHDGDDDNYDYGDATDIDKRVVDEGQNGKKKHVSTEKSDDKAQKKKGTNMGDEPEKSNVIKINDWLEERVANFKKELEESMKKENLRGNYAHVEEYEEPPDDVSFDDTLSTKDNIFVRKYSHDVVDKPGGLERMPQIGEINADSSSSSSESRTRAHTNKGLSVKSDRCHDIAPQRQPKVANDAGRNCEEQESFDENYSLVEINCDINVKSLDGNQSLAEYQCGGMPEECQLTNSLPLGWEAILDQDSGDYYYTNWNTGETTWDCPQLQNEEPPNGVAYKNGDRTTDVPALADREGITCCQVSHYDAGSSEIENSANIFFEDDNTVNSAIAALNRWNEPVTAPVPLEMKNGSVEGDEDEFAWSDDDEDGDQFDSSSNAIHRSRSNPWHKNYDNTSVSTLEWK